MCGICGFIEPARDVGPQALEARVRRMAGTLRHRGPDGAGAFVDPAAGIALGHRRLAVIAPGAAGAQPMRSQSGRYVLVYNGELYDAPALREALERRGAHFRGRCDTEVLLAAIEAHGVEGALPRLEGMFAFAVWDTARRRLSLVRDRLGKKPLYYAWMGRRFLFGSELRALRAHSHFEAAVDRDAVGSLVQLSYVPAPRTILSGVHKLSAGCVLHVDAEPGAATCEPQPWWSLRELFERGARDPLRLDAVEAVERLAAQLRIAVERRRAADVPLGALLSGGVDSGAVVALLQAQSAKRVQTFTVGFEDPRLDESAAAARIAAHLGTEHHAFVATAREALALVPRLPELYDEPLADTSQIPTALLARQARRHVTVALSGDGGDELFAGYDRYFRARSRWRAMRMLPLAMRRGLARGLAARPPLERAALALEADAVEDLFVRLNLRCRDADALVPGARPLPDLLRERERWPRLAEPVEAMMWLDLAQRLPESILVKVDRASMGVGLEVRSPLLDLGVVSLCARLPPSIKLRAGPRKWLLRDAVAQELPEAFLGGRKRGFGAPVGGWLRGPLRDWAEGLLSEERLSDAGLWNVPAVRALWTQHLARRPDRSLLLWNVLSFQAWHEAWREGPASARSALRGMR